MMSAEEHLLALHRTAVLPEIMVLAEEHLLAHYRAVCCSAKVTCFPIILFDMTNVVEYIINDPIFVPVEINSRIGVEDGDDVSI